MFILVIELKGKYTQLKDEETEVDCQKTEVSI